MKYVSIDIETTGLDESRHQIIEFGAVLDDLREQRPLEDLPRFHAYVLPPQDLDPASVFMISHGEGKDYRGDPFALQMNARILERIAKREPGYDYLSPSQLHLEFGEWCTAQGLWEEQDLGRGMSGPQVKFVAGGKNFGSFDRKFLDSWGVLRGFRVHHRSVDPAMLFFDPAVDDVPPDLATCMSRAGIEGGVTHEAVDDALQVVKLLRAAFPLVDGRPTRKVFACPG